MIEYPCQRISSQRFAYRSLWQWLLLSVTIGLLFWKSPFHADQPVGYMTMHDAGGRLGSKLFAYADLIGIAKQLNFKPFLTPDNPIWKSLNEHFDLKLIPVLNISKEHAESFNFVVIGEASPHRVTNRIMKLRPSQGNYILHGHFNVFYYFKNIEALVRDHFLRSFRSSVVEECQARIEEIAKNVLEVNCHFISVHVRRGDFLDKRRRNFGHVAADPAYLHRALQYYRTRYKGTCVRFLVLGDDKAWNTEKMKSMNQSNDIFVLDPSATAAVDLCILSKCEDSIITTGTFGWMSAFLTGGQVAYQDKFAENALKELYEPEQYFPTHWVGL